MQTNISSIDHQDTAIITSKIANNPHSPKMVTTIMKLSNGLQAIGIKQHEQHATTSSLVSNGDNARNTNNNNNINGSSKKRRQRKNRSRSRSNSFNTNNVNNGSPGNRNQRSSHIQRDRSNSFGASQKNVRFSLNGSSSLSLPATLANPVPNQRIFVNTGMNNNINGMNRYRQRSNSESKMYSNDNLMLNTMQPNFRQRHYSQRNINNNINTNTKPGMSNDYVSRQIMDYYQRNRQSNEKYKAKQILRESLENTLKQSFPNYFINLYIIGSSTNGIGDNASTVDICVLAQKKLSTEQSVENSNDKNAAENNEDDKSKDEKSSDNDTIVQAVADSNLANDEDIIDGNENLTLNHIEKILQRKNFAKNILLIPARVPIIKFNDIICNMSVTLNLNQDVSIRNTQLIRDYSKMDWRFPQLAMIVKEWARENRIDCAFDKSISPYSWTLMVIHYLQALEPPVLPCLQKLSPQRYDINISIDEERNIWRQPPIKWQSQNTNSLKQLMKGFFRYYGYVFHYDQHIISVREGKVLNRIYHQRTLSTTSTASTSNGGNDDNSMIQWNSLMCVEEPFNRTNTTRCVKDHATFERIKELLRMSSNALKGNRISLFNIIVDDLEFPIKY
uniref:Poly(A)RNA polymerase GLD2-like n=1 Tax=Psoroptes ovis TaxID=83912 RepID=A0A3B0QQF8_PSOOV|nr:poly(A)RNA polymerase GLD2-like [Psoroptes ovis]